MAMALSGQVTKSRLVAEAQKEAERMRDVQLLLGHLLRQEDVTIRFILDCLYDVGSVNLINQKVRAQPLNQLAKAIAVMSKPAFKVFALRWLYKNCPRLITNWLHRKVRFSAPDTQPTVTATKVLEAQATPAPIPAPLVDTAAPVISALQAANLAPTLEHDQQIQQLRHQVRWLTGLLVGMVLLWSGSIAVPYYTSGAGSASLQEKVLQKSVQQP